MTTATSPSTSASPSPSPSPPASPGTASSPPSRAAVITAFAVVYLVWGSTYLAMRIGVRTLPPFLLSGVRFVVAGGVLSLWYWLRTPARPRAVHWRYAAAAGLLLLVGGNGVVVWAVQYVPSSLAALVVATMPLWIVLFQWIGGGERPGLAVAGGVAGGLVGVALLLGPDRLFAGATTHADPVAGIALLFAAVSWAAGSLLTRRAPPLPEAPLFATGLQMLVGGTVLLALSVATGEPRLLAGRTISTESLVALAYLVVFGSLLGYSAFIWLMQNVSPAKASTYAYVNPVIAVMLGWLLGGEPLGARTLIAAAVILASVALIGRGAAGKRR